MGLEHLEKQESPPDKEQSYTKITVGGPEGNQPHLGTQGPRVKLELRRRNSLS